MTEEQVNKALKASELSEGERRAIIGKTRIGDDGRRRLFFHLETVRRKAEVAAWLLCGEVKEIERYNDVSREATVIMKDGHRVKLQL